MCPSGYDGSLDCRFIGKVVIRFKNAFIRFFFGAETANDGVVFLNAREGGDRVATGDGDKEARVGLLRGATFAHDFL